MALTHIHSTTAKQAHQELLTALGSENNPAQWLVFMNTAKAHLPFLFKNGRPTKKQIENSIIGQLGFSSWSEMVKADQNKQGLAWSWSSWKKWSKAFKVVNEYAYLAEMNITANAVMKFKSTFKDDFPASAEALEQAKAETKARKEKEEAEKVSNLKARVSELEQQLVAASAKLEVLEKQSNEFTSQQRQLVELQSQQSKVVSENESLVKKNNELSSTLKALKSMSRWDHLKAFLSSRTQ
ncbi:MAG: hypothetical protein CL491_00915 [Acinetobacter sp.]|uniref:hypothetical protein n=1 Tax=Acinetobacter sp. TaxID=472 RepID=UPI000C621337|nr:hypothetical protein [Acinetobacter sp.]MBT48652.1 hypothetical protein [Acinetobacter sp.]|tara:strand:- start:5097 stop:5816 length:720 start_codon:yes stop_codon:yes gene_type:complete